MNNASSTTGSPQLDAYLEKLGISFDDLLYYITHHKLGNYVGVLFGEVRTTKLVHKFVIAAGALYVYDFLVTFDEEVDFAWSARKWWHDGVRLVFLLNRYIPICLIGTGIFLNTSMRNVPPFVATQQACRLPPVILLLSLVTFGAIEVILMLRVWILWEKSRIIGTLLAIVFLVGLSLGVGLIHVEIKYFFPLALFPSNIVAGCPLLDYAEKGAYKGAYAYFLGAAIECIMFSLLISKVWMATRRSSPIISALINHGALHYSVVLLGFILAIISTMRAEFNFPVFRANVMIVTCSISCNYLMIGLRRVDGSLVAGVTEIDETWEARQRNTMDFSTFANEALAHTRHTDSSPWDVEMSSRPGRSNTGEG